MMQIPTMIWIFFLAPLIIAGVTAFWLGLRGRRTGAHPVCRACGFDLRAQPPASARCPECGALLNRTRAVAIGDRHRRPFLAIIGAAAVVLSLAFVSLNIIAQLENLDASKYKPVWWLIRDTESTAIVTREAALKELLSRLNSGVLSKNQINTLADRALVLQADLKKPWVIDWGDILEQAHATGTLPDEKWKQYARQTAVFHLVVRPIVRRGDQIPVSLEGDNLRCGSSQSFWLAESFTLDSKEWGRDKYETGVSSSGMGGSSRMGTSIQIDPKKEALLPDGEHVLKFTVHAKISALPYPGGQLLAEVPIHLEAPFKLVAASQKTVSAVDDSTLQSLVEQSITARDFEWDSYLKVPYIQGMIDIKGAPTDLAFDVVLRADGQEQSLGHINFAKGATSGWGVGNEVTGTIPDDVDLVFKPDIEAARQTINLTTLWNGTITIHHVHINGTSPLSSRPTTRNR